MAPQYSEADFRFIYNALRDNWPQANAPKLVETVVEKEVIKYVNTGKASKLSLANEYLFGINHEENAEFALRIYS